MEWTEYFLKIAEVVKLKSKDKNTQIGVVLVGSNNEIISTGYNSFPRGINDNVNEIDDFIAEQQLDEEIDNENRDMAFMNEDYMDGDYYGDEVAETMDEYD